MEMLGLRFGIVISLAAVGAFVACGSESDDGSGNPSTDAGTDADDGPTRICKPPATPGGAWFEDATDAFGVGKTDQLEPLANQFVSADFDGDGWNEVLAMRGESTRGLVNEKRVRFLFLNRPSAGNPAERVLVDEPSMNGLLSTRDGTNDRGLSLVSVGDVNNDGSTDVVACPGDFDQVTTILDPCVALLNDGTGHFTLAPSDIDTEHPSTSIVLVDYDRDGVLDVFMPGMARWPNPSKTVWSYGPRLFKGVGDGTFQNVSADVGLPQTEGFVLDSNAWQPTLGATSCDLDDDGDMDFLLSTYGRKPNQVYRNDGGQFVEVSGALGLDHDDRMDYSDDESYRCYCAVNTCDPMPPAPKVNCNAFGGPYLRGWSLGISDEPYSLGGNNMGVTCGDIDDDGDMDVSFATIVHGDTGSASDPTELILNPGNGGKFTRPGNEVTGLLRPALKLTDNHGDHQVAYADFDLDGRKDVWDASIVYPGTHQWLWHQKSDGTFEEITVASGLHASGKPATLGMNLVDIDGDGDLDFVTGRYTEDRSVRVFRNLVGQNANWVRIRLVGKGAGFSNVSGIGARVKVTAGGRTQTQEVRGGQGLSNIQNDLTLTFGLGDACDVDDIEVRWPDLPGTIAHYTSIRANYTVVLREGEAEPSYPGVTTD